MADTFLVFLPVAPGCVESNLVESGQNGGTIDVGVREQGLLL